MKWKETEITHMGIDDKFLLIPSLIVLLNIDFMIKQIIKNNNNNHNNKKGKNKI